MKAKAIITAGLFIILSSPIINTFAQTIDEPAIKILPTVQKGILKVLYAYNNNEAVEVKFFNADGPIVTDKIKSGTFQNGFSKKYDVRKTSPGDLWVEVSSEDLSVTYRLVESNDGKGFVPLLEKTTYNHQLVASNTSLGLN
ncbi:MAG: hypothetical protein HOP08_12815 [Cyclobacteriaceae bacterium]|nr:hypothetical protein [Cyclobacteriaceae bacterium]